MSQRPIEDRFRKNLRRELRKHTRFRRLLRRAVRLIPEPIRKAFRPEKPDPIPLLIAEFAASTPNVTFVQIGSCDGKTGDPINQYVVRHGWKGAVVEPVPYNFERLQETYRGNDNVSCQHVAISDREEVRPFYHMRKTEGLPVWHQQIGSFYKEHLLKHDLLMPDLADYIEETPLQCITFDQLLERCGIETLDLLHVDTEGFDYEILKQVDFSRLRPKVVLYEEMHLSDEDRDAAAAMLESHGYEVTSNTMDAIGLLRS